MSARTCPCCGAPVAAETVIDIACRAVSPTMALILRAVARHPGLSSAELAGMVWRNVPGGGPLYAAETIRATIWRNRARLAGTGLQLVTPNPGFRTGYKIEIKEAA